MIYMNKVVIKILQDRVVTRTMLGGLAVAYMLQMLISCSVYVPKIIQMGWR